MNNEANIWLERVSSFHHSLMRRAAGMEGLQLVHFEILRYLSLCNHHSNTAQALSAYLGQTKGSISQSLNFLEEQGYVEWRDDARDKRYVRLFLTESGKECLSRMGTGLIPEVPDDPALAESLRRMMETWQKTGDSRGFGLCRTCKYNLNPADGEYACAFLQEKLTATDVTKICFKHEF